MNNDKNNDGINDELTWPQITDEIGKGNIGFIKGIISSNDVDINAKNPENGKTLLIYSVIIGNIDLVNIVCNFGADVHLKDDDDMDALDYAIKYGQYKITELLYYRQLSGSLGNDMKIVAGLIHEKDKQAALMVEFSSVICSNIVKYMTYAIQQRASFGDGMYNLCWIEEEYVHRCLLQTISTQIYYIMHIILW